MQITGEITYTRKRLIGEGYSAKVYLADDHQLGGEIAVKEISKTHFSEGVNKFFSEAQTMFSVSHTNIVPIMCAFQTNDMICLAMKYFKNGSLHDRCSVNPIGLKETIRIGQEVLTGLASIHAKGFVHFDLKPSNVLFSDRGVAMVADFGQTQPMRPDGLASLPALYVAGIAPECYSTGAGVVQSDVYQAGLTLYRAVNGNAVFDVQRLSTAGELGPLTVAGKFPNRDKFLPHVPRQLRTVIRTALQVDLAKRYPTATEFADALARVKVGLDWKVQTFPDGTMKWEAERVGKPGISVELYASGTKWGVQLFRNGVKTQRFRTQDWRIGLTRGQAMKHLRTLFEKLE